MKKLTTVRAWTSLGAGKFGLYEVFKVKYRELMGDDFYHRFTSLIYLAASASAEFFADILLCPLESVKVRVQTIDGYANGVMDGIPKMINEEGFGTLYKSIVPLWFRQIPYTMMKFASFEKTVVLLYKYVVPKPREQCTKGQQLIVTFAAGYIAGVFCAVVSHPADTLVSQMSKQKGVSAKEIAQKLGFYGLWKGLGLRIAMIGTLTALQWFIYDGFKVYMRMPRPPPA
ncbi:phosphate carrier protein, mitochondrial-like [Ctenocephalides felis]|uniref:phosphate carrier protein, mitochondrial-like n=1 Tax=Ctenocephalides felis TaxID=7515 RepID=UPI000E6E1878|nr:phosphate carrier protein, mitochondrial-like [Ctenocephalides felis]